MSEARAVGPVLRRLMARAPSSPIDPPELAKRAGVSRSTVYRHLQGVTPTRGSVAAHSRVFGLSEATLSNLMSLGDRGQPPDTTKLRHLLSQCQRWTPRGIGSSGT
jgi:hypothetical protein